MLISSKPLPVPSAFLETRDFSFSAMPFSFCGCICRCCWSCFWCCFLIESLGPNNRSAKSNFNPQIAHGLVIVVDCCPTFFVGNASAKSLTNCHLLFCNAEMVRLNVPSISGPSKCIFNSSKSRRFLTNASRFVRIDSVFTLTNFSNQVLCFRPFSKARFNSSAFLSDKARLFSISNKNCVF